MDRTWKAASKCWHLQLWTGALSVLHGWSSMQAFTGRPWKLSTLPQGSCRASCNTLQAWAVWEAWAEQLQGTKGVQRTICAGAGAPLKSLVSACPPARWHLNMHARYVSRAVQQVYSAASALQQPVWSAVHRIDLVLGYVTLSMPALVRNVLAGSCFMTAVMTACMGAAAPVWGTGCEA